MAASEPTFALADLFEIVADAVPDREALVCGSADGARQRRTYRQLDRRADLAAGELAARGVTVGDRVGVHLANHAGHVEVLLGLLKLRAVPVNLNTRYLAGELAYVLDDAGAVVVVVEPGTDDLWSAVETTGPLAVATLHDLGASSLDGVARGGGQDEGSSDVGSEADGAPGVVAARRPRSGDDLMLLYTGGTTGRPKGVMWRQADLYQAALGGRGTPSQGVAPTVVPTDVVRRATGHDPIRRRLPFCPLFHGGALWVVLQSLLSGGTAILSSDAHFDGEAACDLLAGERAELTMVIGDAVARPIADALARHPRRWDLASLAVVASGGAVLSPAVAGALRDALPGVKVVDTFGASETGGQGRLVRDAAGRPVLRSDEDTEVLDDSLVPVAPGAVGRLARRGAIPLGYWGDADKTAATFPTVDGVRWSVPGDLARREPDGSITLLGRGSTSINTGGEKVFPEEVEGVCKAHPAVRDALVVGTPDDRFGERVTAVIALRPGTADPGDDALVEHCRAQLAGYKVPRRWVRVERCERLVTGKPDYAWARAVAQASSST